jgi:hypothetical protein
VAYKAQPKETKPTAKSIESCCCHGRRARRRGTYSHGGVSGAVRWDEKRDQIRSGLPCRLWLQRLPACREREGMDGFMRLSVRSFRRLATAAAWLLALLIDPEGRPAGRTITPRKWRGERPVALHSYTQGATRPPASLFWWYFFLPINQSHTTLCQKEKYIILNFK